MANSTAAHKQTIREAEEMLGTEHKGSFVGSFYTGQLYSKIGLNYPSMSAADEKDFNPFREKVRAFLREKLNSTEIDRKQCIPKELVHGLFDIGVMAMSIPKEYGGLGFSQFAYCKIIEEFGAADASVTIMINAHQSIGIRSLILFGSPEQKKVWLPKLIQGKMLAAFGLTEPNAGSDAGSLETRAVPSADGSHFVINGRKRWITNGGIAGMITVMAKVPDTQDQKGREKITAFLVTPETPGFSVDVLNDEKCGIRGTTTTRLLFKDMKVPKENIIGPPGKGLRVALTVLDFGRITFGASCTGVAKRCVKDAIAHANERVQFGKSLKNFELVKKKIALISSLAYAMEATTYFTAQLIDRDKEEYMLETAILKVFASESLWEVINETIQIMGGKAYFTDQPYEQLMRDARINMIGEGANDVMRTFIALGGIRSIDQEIKKAQSAIKSPFQGMGALKESLSNLLGFSGGTENLVKNSQVQEMAENLVGLIRTFSRRVKMELVKHQLGILDKQYIQKRISDMVTDLYVMSAVIARLDHAFSDPKAEEKDLKKQYELGSYFCKNATKRIRANLDEFGFNFDEETTRLADLMSES